MLSFSFIERSFIQLNEPMARAYRQGRRSESAETTRQRIVQATFELHNAQGIAATSMKEIAARAGVSVGSVYHHFPTYDDAISACGAHAFSLTPLPGGALFAGLETRAVRVAAAVAAQFATFAALPAMASVIADQEKLPVLKAFVAQEAALRRALAAEALQDDGPAADTLAALMAHGSFDAFTRQGLSPEAAAQRVAEVANAWLDTVQPEEAP